MATTEAEAKAEDPVVKEKKASGRPKKEPPPPKQRNVRASKADEKVQKVIDYVKAAKEPVTYQEIMDACDVLYDVCQFSLTALALEGLVEKVGTWEGTGRARVAFQWAGKK
jgi:predicted Rossmann fold nucleotide-binding protein DprA/Smf involved in DNA uptake